MIGLHPSYVSAVPSFIPCECEDKQKEQDWVDSWSSETTTNCHHIIIIQIKETICIRCEKKKKHQIYIYIYIYSYSKQMPENIATGMYSYGCIHT